VSGMTKVADARGACCKVARVAKVALVTRVTGEGRGGCPVDRQRRFGGLRRPLRGGKQQVRLGLKARRG